MSDRDVPSGSGAEPERTDPPTAADNDARDTSPSDDSNATTTDGDSSTDAPTAGSQGDAQMRPQRPSLVQDGPTPVTQPIAGDDMEAEDLLAPVPEPGAPADRRSEVARWIVTWTEPLIDDASRARTTADMGRFISRNSDWSCAYLAGVLTDLAHSLPSNDPWRHMAALIDLDQVATGHLTEDPEKRLARRSEHVPLPASTGAVTVEGRPFGTRRDALDLVPAGVSDATTDVGMVALATNLSPLAAALVGFASHEARTVQYVLNQVYHHLWLANFGSVIDQSAGEALLDSAGAAIRWLIYRRRAYTGPEDPFPNVVGFTWISIADRVNAGKPIGDEAGKLARDNAIDESMYRYITGSD